MRFIPIMLAATLFAAPAMAAELTGTLQKIKETGTIALGVRDSSVPFSYLDNQQRPVGYAVDICYKIVDAVKKELKLPNLKVQLVPVLSSNRIPLMANGTIDLECGSTTNNAEREKQVAFTNTHFLTASRFVSKKAAHLNSIDSLRGKTVVSTSGTTNIVQLNEVNAARKLGINVVAAKDHAEAFLMVETDRAAAFVMDDVILSSFVAASKDSVRLRRQRRRVLRRRTLRDHAAARRRAVQGAGRQGDIGPVSQPGGQGDLREVVPVADSAERAQSERADVERHAARLRASVGQSRSGELQSID